MSTAFLTTLTDEGLEFVDDFAGTNEISRGEALDILVKYGYKQIKRDMWS